MQNNPLFDVGQAVPVRVDGRVRYGRVTSVYSYFAKTGCWYDYSLLLTDGRVVIRGQKELVLVQVFLRGAK